MSIGSAQELLVRMLGRKLFVVLWQCHCRRRTRAG